MYHISTSLLSIVFVRNFQNFLCRQLYTLSLKPPTPAKAPPAEAGALFLYSDLRRRRVPGQCLEILVIGHQKSKPLQHLVRQFRGEQGPSQLWSLEMTS